MRSGFNPSRRNRNIGTGKQGHGRDNSLVIPRVCVRGRGWSEQINPHLLVRRSVSGREVTFIVEETHDGCAHACTVNDICRVLAHVPADDWEKLDTFVLRQSSRKQRLLRPAWGRLLYFADLRLPGRATLREGPAVILEAFERNAVVEWTSSRGPSDIAELDRLKDDGHHLTRIGHRHVFSSTPAAVRATQLYRTLLHEIGHWVDYLQRVVRPASDDAGEFARLSEAYFQRPTQEREAFAHRYADAMRGRLVRFGILPFDSIPEMTEPIGAATIGRGDSI